MRKADEEKHQTQSFLWTLFRLSALSRQSAAAEDPGGLGLYGLHTIFAVLADILLRGYRQHLVRCDESPVGDLLVRAFVRLPDDLGRRNISYTIRPS